jgi:hypothetical protein
MASSVLSEWAFLQGGIAISKHHNHLKGDIVKAPQCVKCAICHDLLFREPGPSSLAKEEPDEFKIEVEPSESPNVDATEEEGWDTLFLEEDDNNMESETDETYQY